MMRILFPGVYGLVVVAAVLYMYANAHESAFCGLYAILATLPWSMLATYVFPALYTYVPGIAVIGASAFVNCGLLYLLGDLFDHGLRSGSQERASAADDHKA